MVLSCRSVLLRGSKATGIVVRPRPSGGSTCASESADSSGGPGSPNRALVFTEDGGVHELPGCGTDAGGWVDLGPRLAACEYRCRHPTYDASTGAVYLRGCSVSAYQSTSNPEAVLKLDSSNDCSIVAESGYCTRSREDTLCGYESMAADGRGGLWVMDSTLASADLRYLDARSRNAGAAESPAMKLPRAFCALASDVAAGTLMATTSTAVFRLCAEEGGSEELVAGSSKDKGSVDGVGPAARFADISALLPVSGGRLLIADGPNLRCMDAGGAVTTLLQGCFAAGSVRQLAVLPGGELAALCEYRYNIASLVLITGASLCTTQSSGVPTPLLGALVQGPGDCSGGGSGAAASWAVTVRLGDQAFHAHRSVLAAGSEYFARLLSPGGGFAESGAPEVSLPDADPDAFAHLLSYMYGSSLGLPCTPAQLLLSVPFALLRPTAALAGRLLMEGVVVSAFTDQLAAAATPSTVMASLLWAEDHGLNALAARLRSYAIEHRKTLDLSALADVVDANPKRAKEVMSKLLRA